MSGRRVLLAITLLLGFGSVAVASERDQPEVPVQVAQACGWFAIYSCSTRAGEVQNFISRTGFGFMIDSSSNMFPNFRPGFYCAGDGPMNKSRADAFVREALHSGMAPTAYAKRSC
jgi:hypothetical protein